MSLLSNRITAVVAGSVLVVGIGATGAVAGDLIGSSDIRDGGVHQVDLGAGLQGRIENKATDRQVNGLEGRVSGLEGQSDSGSDLIVGAGYTSTWKAGEFGQTVETCPEGQYAIGGGDSTFGAFNGVNDGYDLGGTNRDIQVTVSAPYFKGEYEPVDEAGNFRADQWVVRGFNNGESDQIVRAWVVCSNLAD